jgi:twitching motility two-component system response regulator PilH
MTEHKRVLVINDTKEILELFRDVLEREMGHQVILMSFAPDELERIVEHRPDLVIVDFMIGEREMEGWQLLQKMRMHPTTADIPIVACTAAIKQVRETEAYLLEQGIEVVLKPFTIEQLEGAVKRALEGTVKRGSPGSDQANASPAPEDGPEPTADEAAR